MADEAFALSPISARAVQPNEADYEAIREAFMETSRGRWFLGEYAKRNRNADTAMVLDAVARIEEALAAQRQEPPRNERLAEALAVIATAVDAAAEAASDAFAGLQLQENLAPIHKGTRIIKEISWRWREIGADGRICDLIDAQIAAIEASCERLTAVDGRTMVGAAFDLIRRRLDELRESDGVLAEAGEAPIDEAPAAPPTAGQTAMRPLESAAAASAAAFAEPEASAGPSPADAAIAETEGAPAETAVAPSGRDAMDAEAADAHDEAVLEMVAIEMAAPDPVEDFLADEAAEVHTTLPPPVEPVITKPTDKAPQPQPEMAATAPERPHILPEPAPAVAVEPSLGSTIIANGLVPRSKAPSDPLAPIRRMSQAEKVAFFS
jgi:hypothetical protein